MTSELVYLTLSALLAGSLWIPFVIGQGGDPKGHTDFTRPPDITQLRPWVQRSFRAHQNAIETTLPFAIVVLVAHVAGLSNSVTGTAAAVFFWTRLVHAAGMISGLAIFPIRPIIFSVSYACTVVIAVMVLLGSLGQHAHVEGA
ncbi:MAPEG family protein [Epibacterium ulvae]|uniref:MAPEG family protein n=1 Tax=Epibacterium ulvae TaxID=1156985 RepID=UPI001BFC5C40|nr:MAPEG family protein [Epibacterium ulvae]MBT8152951.1 MAPEG family protein [Epibacterium ulvae]